MGKEEKVDAYLTAHGMLTRAKEWHELCEKSRNGEMVATPKPITDEKGMTSYVYTYEPANPGVVAREIQDRIAGMDTDTRELVFGEIAKVAEEAQSQIDENGGSWLCPAGETMKACNALNSFRTFVEEKEAGTDEAPTA